MSLIFLIFFSPKRRPAVKMEEVMTAKLLAMFLLGVVSLALGLLPLRLTSLVSGDSFWKRTVTSVLLCYGGGVLFATGMIHMLPEVIGRKMFTSVIELNLISELILNTPSENESELSLSSSSIYLVAVMTTKLNCFNAHN